MHKRMAIRCTLLLMVCPSDLIPSVLTFSTVKRGFSDDMSVTFLNYDRYSVATSNNELSTSTICVTWEINVLAITIEGINN